MNPKDYWIRMSWSQPYANWPTAQAKPRAEPEMEDLTLAREVLARIMTK
jgi:hypothetical protein